jgi:hydroxymethylpyrimidine pyrophosphatase-like HAD family hydrolase
LEHRIRAIGIDFDGTLTDEDRPAEETLASLQQARAAGIRLVLVTGRILAELRGVFPDAANFFDAMVLENGAVLARRRSVRPLVAAVPLELDEALLHRDVPFRRGQVLLATTRPYAPVVLEEISRLGLDCALVQNRGELMVLPAGVTKGTGLSAALAGLGVSPHDAAGIGDAENDHSLLNACEIGVAVANAVPALKAHADLVLAEPAGRGVVSFLRGPWLSGEQPIHSGRWQVTIGRFPDGSPVLVPSSGVNVLFTGKTLVGKSFAAGLFAERLLARRYSLCVIDPEGDHLGLGGLHGCMIVGGREPLPRPEQLSELFQPTFSSVVVDLSQHPRAQRTGETVRLLAALQRQREESGFPHWIFVEEAHTALEPDGPACAGFLPDQKGFCLITFQPDHLCEKAGQSIDLVITVEGPGHARLLRRGEDPPGRAFAFEERITGHVRHRHKYLHADLPTERRFFFCGGDGETGRSAGNLEEFKDELRVCPPGVLRHHVPRHDFSRWVLDVIQDSELGRRVRMIEDDFLAEDLAGRTDELRRELFEEIERRYAESA